MQSQALGYLPLGKVTQVVEQFVTDILPWPQSVIQVQGASLWSFESPLQRVTEGRFFIAGPLEGSCFTFYCDSRRENPSERLKRLMWTMRIASSWKRLGCRLGSAELWRPCVLPSPRSCTWSYSRGTELSGKPDAFSAGAASAGVCAGISAPPGDTKPMSTQPEANGVHVRVTVHSFWLCMLGFCEGVLLIIYESWLSQTVSFALTLQAES